MHKYEAVSTPSVPAIAIHEGWKARWGFIDDLDLSGPMMKVALPPNEGKGWTPEQVEAATLWYKRFLKLCAKYPGAPHVPNGPIDEMWHAHILDTAAYRRDCERIFGGPLDHYPYFGLKDEAIARDSAFDLTNELYKLEFGMDCLSMARLFAEEAAERGMGCNDAGGGTGCGQGCKRAPVSH